MVVKHQNQKGFKSQTFPLGEGLSWASYCSVRVINTVFWEGLGGGIKETLFNKRVIYHLYVNLWRPGNV